MNSYPALLVDNDVESLPVYHEMYSLVFKANLIKSSSVCQSKITEVLSHHERVKVIHNGFNGGSPTGFYHNWKTDYQSKSQSKQGTHAALFADQFQSTSLNRNDRVEA